MNAIARCLAWATVAAVLPAAEAAGSVSLASDLNAMAGWCGVKQFKQGTNKLLANVEYAVYAPGHFDISFPGGDPTDGLEYIYAYQVFNNLNATKAVQKLSVGMAVGEEERPADWGYLVESGRQRPSNPITPLGLGSTEAVWNFNNDPNYGGDCQLSVGEISSVLFYSSPYAPEWDKATVSGGGADVKTLNPGLPSPTPEPATLAMLAGGWAILARRRVLKSR